MWKNKQHADARDLRWSTTHETTMVFKSGGVLLLDNLPTRPEKKRRSANMGRVYIDLVWGLDVDISVWDWESDLWASLLGVSRCILWLHGGAVYLLSLLLPSFFIPLFPCCTFYCHSFGDEIKPA